MFYEEKLIDGVMCYRTDPDGEWKQYLRTDLSSRYAKAMEDLAEMRSRVVPEGTPRREIALNILYAIYSNDEMLTRLERTQVPIARHAYRLADYFLAEETERK